MKNHPPSLRVVPIQEHFDPVTKTRLYYNARLKYNFIFIFYMQTFHSLAVFNSNSRILDIGAGFIKLV